MTVPTARRLDLYGSGTSPFDAAATLAEETLAGKREPTFALLAYSPDAGVFTADFNPTRDLARARARDALGRLRAASRIEVLNDLLSAAVAVGDLEGSAPLTAHYPSEWEVAVTSGDREFRAMMAAHPDPTVSAWSRRLEVAKRDALSEIEGEPLVLVEIQPTFLRTGPRSAYTDGVIEMATLASGRGPSSLVRKGGVNLLLLPERALAVFSDISRDSVARAEAPTDTRVLDTVVRLWDSETRGGFNSLPDLVTAARTLV